jgi:hypothetical protein
LCDGSEGEEHEEEQNKSDVKAGSKRRAARQTVTITIYALATQ